MILALTTHHNTLRRLYITVETYNGSLSFVTSFKNLQELVISTLRFNILDELHATFSNLQILKIPHGKIYEEVFIKFLGNNGRNLIKLKILVLSTDGKLSIPRFCPNLKRFYTVFRRDELDTLKIIFDGFQGLESFRVWCGQNYDYLSEKEMLKVVTKKLS